MKELTREEELHIIESLNEDDLIDNGGGRVVFHLNHNLANELNLPNDTDYVVKIAIGDKGLNQNELEISTYIQFHDTVNLAAIPAIGHILLIMEEVDPDFAICIDAIYCDDCFDDLEDLDAGTEEEFEVDEDDINHEYLTRYLIRDYGYDRDTACDQADSILDLLDCLTDINGYTSDNAQIGRNAKGEWVAYDYGFDPELGCTEQCSNTRDYISDGDYCDLFLNTIMENIYSEKELWLYSPHGLMKKVEEEFFAYIDAENAEDAAADEGEEYCPEELTGSATMDPRLRFDTNYARSKYRYFDDCQLPPARHRLEKITFNKSLICPEHRAWYYSKNMEKVLDKLDNSLYTIYLN